MNPTERGFAAELHARIRKYYTTIFKSHTGGEIAPGEKNNATTLELLAEINLHLRDIANALGNVDPGTVLGSAKVSSGYQISVVEEIRPHLQNKSQSPLKPGDRLRFVLRNGQVVVEKENEESKT